MSLSRRNLLSLAFSLSLGLLASSALAAPEAAKAKDPGPAQKAKAVKVKNPVVIIETTYGTITAELQQDRAPETVKNFLEYVDAKHYDGTVFHRVIKGFMNQAGGYDADLNERPTRAPIKNEAANGLKNEPNTLAMARTPMPDSATSQFFINVGNNSQLNHTDDSMQGMGYCVFGRVLTGQDVVKKINEVPTGRRPNGMGDVPTSPITIKSIRVKP